MFALHAAASLTIPCTFLLTLSLQVVGLASGILGCCADDHAGYLEVQRAGREPDLEGRHWTERRRGLWAHGWGCQGEASYAVLSPTPICCSCGL